MKTGGLADVVGAVPKALEQQGTSARVMLPAYPALIEPARQGNEVHYFDELFGGPARLFEVQSDGLDLLLLDAPHLFDRPGNIYLDDNGRDWADNHLRFGALCVAATHIAVHGVAEWKPDVVHAHDWQAGLVPLLIRMRELPEAPKTVITIHNIAFQGLFHWSCRDLFGIPDHLFTPEGAEYYGHLGFLKAGLAFADKITTVSPTYARELLTSEFGMGLEGLLSARQNDLSGILNGIDTQIWNPQTDTALPANYSSRNRVNKTTCKRVLEERFGLSPEPDAPLFCVVSRLTEQKGLDLLLDVLPDLVAQGGRLALLGSGADYLEAGFRAAAQQFQGRVGVVIGYDENLSHLVQAGSDCIVIPSRFEPCGLTQLYGLRYGTLPLVATTGGLADTVVDATPDTIKNKTATGFQFYPVQTDPILKALARACELYSKPRAWKAIMGNAMRTPVGWEQSAPKYAALYRSLSLSE